MDLKKSIQKTSLSLVRNIMTGVAGTALGIIIVMMVTMDSIDKKLKEVSK